MGRPRKSASSPIEPEEKSQVIPDEETAAVIESEDDDELEETEGRSVNRAGLVRKAVAAGYEKPATGVEYIRNHFGAEIDPKYYSVAKSQLRKREAQAPFAEPAKRGRKPKVSSGSVGSIAENGFVKPPEKPKLAGEKPDLLAAMEAIKPLIASLGKDQAHRIIDLLG